MIKANNKIAANWIKISTNLQSQLIASEEDKIKLSAQIASLTAENERLQVLVETAYGEGWDNAIDWPELGVYVNWDHSNTRAALQPKEGEG